MDKDIEDIGKNEKELKMVMEEIEKKEEELRREKYSVLKEWKSYYGGNIMIVMKEELGKEEFMRNEKEWVDEWKGLRKEREKKIEGGERIIEWWKQKGKEKREKILIF